MPLLLLIKLSYFLLRQSKKEGSHRMKRTWHIASGAFVCRAKKAWKDHFEMIQWVHHVLAPCIKTAPDHINSVLTFYSYHAHMMEEVVTPCIYDGGGGDVDPGFGCGSVAHPRWMHFAVSTRWYRIHQTSQNIPSIIVGGVDVRKMRPSHCFLWHPIAIVSWCLSMGSSLKQCNAKHYYS